MTKTLFSGRRNEPFEVLAAVSLFRALRRDEIRHIEALTTEVTVEEGRVLCREGETGREMFVVVEGQAAVIHEGERIATIGPGGFFGEMALLDGGPRVADVIAESPMRLLVLNRTEFGSMVQSVPVVGQRLLKTLGERLRQVQSDEPIV